MAEPTAEIPPELDAYALLSKPTLDLSDDQVELIVADLRRRRELYIKTGKPDRPAKPKAAPKAKATADDKKANTAALLASLDLTLDGKSI